MPSMSQWIAIAGTLIPTTVAVTTDQLDGHDPEALGVNVSAVLTSWMLAAGVKTEWAQRVLAFVGWLRKNINESDLPNGCNADVNRYVAGVRALRSLDESADPLRAKLNAVHDHVVNAIDAEIVRDKRARLESKTNA